MEHVVFFPAHDGTPAFRRLTSLEDAVRFVEHLRNTEGVDQFSVHALTEVPLALRTYYRVEVPEDVAPQATPVAVPEQAGEAAPPLTVVSSAVEDPAPAEDAGVPVPQLAEVPAAPVVAAVPEQEQPAVPAKASMGFFSRG